MKRYLLSRNNICDVKEETVEEENPITPENIGIGLAFLGMVLYVTYVFLFTLSIAMPQMFNLFSGPGHFIVISIICLALIIGGNLITKIKRQSPEKDNN